MGSGTEIPLEVRKLIINLYVQQKSYREIGNIVQRSYSSVRNIINLYVDTGKLERGNRSGRPKKCTPRQERIVVGAVAQNPRISAVKLCNDMQQQTRHVCLTAPQQKYNKKEESDSDDEVKADFKDERDSKVVKTKVNSLRADLLLKAGLGIARNKVENIFYESRIRVNGKKLQKKSVQLHEGDEIDVIRGFSQTNPSHLVVSRVVILSASEREEGLSVHLRRYKSLLIDNYSGANAFKSSAVSDH